MFCKVNTNNRKHQTSKSFVINIKGTHYSLSVHTHTYVIACVLRLIAFSEMSGIKRVGLGLWCSGKGLSNKN